MCQQADTSVACDTVGSGRTEKPSKIDSERTSKIQIQQSSLNSEALNAGIS